MPISTRGCVVLLLFLASACSGNGTTTSPSPLATNLPTFSLSGQVTMSGAATGIPGATVSIVDSVNAGKSATTDGSGNYSFAALQQSGFTVNVQAAGFTSSSRGVTLTSNQTLSLTLSRSSFSVSGTVTDGFSGRGLPGASVAGGGKSTSTNADGQYVLAEVLPGRVSISASIAGHETVTRNVTVSSDATVDLLLPPILSPCEFLLTSSPGEMLDRAGGSGVVTMTRTVGSCSWTVNTEVCDDPASCKADLSWLTLLDLRGSGDVRVGYTFTAREESAPARGAIIQVRWPGGKQDILLEQ